MYNKIFEIRQNINASKNVEELYSVFESMDDIKIKYKNFGNLTSHELDCLSDKVKNKYKLLTTK